MHTDAGNKQSIHKPNQSPRVATQPTRAGKRLSPRDQINLIPTSLDDLICPASHIRLIDNLLDHLDWTVFNEAYRYEKRGRPPIYLRILAAVWIWAFFRRIRSSRSLEYRLHTNVDMVRLAKKLGIIKIAGLYVDATRIKADAS